MGTVASTNAGLTDLMQTLTSVGSPLASSALAPAVQSALQNASPADIVELSDAALALQQTDAMFGVSDTGQSTDPLSALISSAMGNTTTGATSSTGDQLSAAEAALQSQQTAALFGMNTDPTSSSSLLSTTG